MRGRLLVLALFVTLGLSLLTQPGGVFVQSAQAATEDEYFELMKLFVDTFEQIDRNYVKPVDRRELLDAAMRGMVLKLDPYSSYIDTSELNRRAIADPGSIQQPAAGTVLLRRSARASENIHQES